jgi:hypothetical protein
MTTEQEQSKINVERHLQTLIVIIIVGLLGWVGTTVQSTEVAVARLTVELEFLKEEMRVPITKFENFERRLDRIEQSLNTHMNNGN